MNLIHLSGYIGQVKPIRQAGSSQVLRFSLATNKRWKNANGETQEKTTWFHCSVWGARAGGLAKVLEKGQLVEVYGSHESREYSDNDGVTRTAWEVNVEGLSFLGPKGQGGGRGPASGPRKAEPSAPPDPSEPDVSWQDPDSDIPF